MTNMTRHAAATAATVTVILDRTLHRGHDNGRGGAPDKRRGLQGLRDRVV
jgi:signal transduction histidine kinase